MRMAMSPKSALLFKVLLNRFHAGVKESFLKNLPKEEVSEVAKQTISSAETGPALTWMYDLLARTHYSWLTPIVGQLPASLQKLVIAAFPEKQLSGMKKLLKIDSLPDNLAPAMKTFLLGQFYRRWQPRDAIPVGYLPQSPLRPLLDLTKQELVQLIELLSLYDVAEAIRHIVDKNKLTAIYRCLGAQQQRFLRQCLHKKERIAAPKLNIDKWDGDPEKFHLILHRRGMFRLSKALSGQAKPFLWHVVPIRLIQAVERRF